LIIDHLNIWTVVAVIEFNISIFQFCMNIYDTKLLACTKFRYTCCYWTQSRGVKFGCIKSYLGKVSRVWNHFDPFSMVLQTLFVVKYSLYSWLKNNTFLLVTWFNPLAAFLLHSILPDFSQLIKNFANFFQIFSRIFAWNRLAEFSLSMRLYRFKIIL